MILKEFPLCLVLWCESMGGRELCGSFFVQGSNLAYLILRVR